MSNSKRQVFFRSSWRFGIRDPQTGSFRAIYGDQHATAIEEWLEARISGRREFKIENIKITLDLQLVQGWKQLMWMVYFNGPPADAIALLDTLVEKTSPSQRKGTRYMVNSLPQSIEDHEALGIFRTMLD